MIEGKETMNAAQLYLKITGELGRKPGAIDFAKAWAASETAAKEAVWLRCDTAERKLIDVAIELKALGKFNEELLDRVKAAEAERDRAVRSLFSPYHVTEDSCGTCRACGHYVENFESFMKPSSHRSDCVWMYPVPAAKDDLCENHGYVSKAICPECGPAPTKENQ